MEQQQRDQLMQSMHRLKKMQPWPMTALSRGEFFMLHKISHLVEKEQNNPGAKISKLSKATDMSKPAVSQMLNSLENKGFIERILTKEDRRVVYVNLTEKGTKVLKKAHTEMDNLLRQMLEELGPEDTAELTRIADKLFKILEKIKKNETFIN